MKNFTWSWDEPEEDTKDDEIDFPESLAEDIKQAEQEMQALDQALDPDGLGPEGQQAWNAFQRTESRTWEWEERRYGQERLAYCGFEEF